MTKQDHVALAEMLKDALAAATHSLNEAESVWFHADQIAARIAFLKAEGRLDGLHPVVKKVAEICAADDPGFDHMWFTKAVYGDR